MTKYDTIKLQKKYVYSKGHQHSITVEKNIIFTLNKLSKRIISITVMIFYDALCWGEVMC